MKKSAAVYHIISISRNGSERLIAVRRASSKAAALKGWEAESGHTALPGHKQEARLA